MAPENSVKIILLFIFISMPYASAESRSDTGESIIQSNELQKLIRRSLTDTNECPFAKNINKLNVEKATEYATTAYNNDDIHFYYSIDGFGPSRPNFEFHFTRCVFLKAKWKGISAGGDAIYNCKDESKLKKKAYEYVSRFNLQMTKLVRKDPKSYPCPKAITYK